MAASFKPIYSLYFGNHSNILFSFSSYIEEEKEIVWHQITGHRARRPLSATKSSFNVKHKRGLRVIQIDTLLMTNVNSNKTWDWITIHVKAWQMTWIF
jgi:hypothetical protein